MIVDIENKGDELKVSTFSPEGNISFVHVPIPPEERFVWQICSHSDRDRDKVWKNWEGSSIKKYKNQKYDKYRILQLLEEADPELTKPLWEFQTPKKFFVDIEVEMTDEMKDSLDTEKAKNKILSIGIATDKCKLIVLGLDDLDAEQQGLIYQQVNEYLQDTGDTWDFKIGRASCRERVCLGV